MALELASVCPLDCPDTCSLTVTVERERVIAVRGSRANPYTAGVLCAKVPAAYPDWVHGPGRLASPLRRVGVKGEGRFAPIGWDEALDTIHARVTAVIAEHGPQAVLPLNYAGPHGMLAGGSMDLRFFHRLGASLLDRKPLCGGIRTEAWLGTYGAAPGIRPEEAREARLIVVWGNNVTWCNLHLTPIINEARRRGARLVVIDPVRVKLAEQADLHLALRPGTDVVLAWALATELERRGAFHRAFIEAHVTGVDAFMAEARRYPPAVAAKICGVPEADILRLAEWYHTLSPAAISVGNGLERNQNGGSGCRAVFALPALAGKWGVSGGGLINGASQAFPKTPARLQRPDLATAGTRMLNIVDVGRHLLDPALAPPIKALFIYNHNPLIVHPDQNRMRRGLARADLFTVAADVVMTDSLAYADIVLPASSHFEYADLYPAYGTHWLQRADAVIPPQGASLPNTEIFRRLAARFGFTEPCFRASDAELMDEAVDAADPRMRGLTGSRVPLAAPLAMEMGGEPAALFRTVRPRTPSGKVELSSPYLAEKYGAPLPTFRPVEDVYPLTLLSPASDRRITSTFGGLATNDGTPPLAMHPDDARARGLAEGAMVRVWNDLGEVHLPLRITDAVRPGVVCSLKGAWMRTSDNGQTVSALAPGHHADLAGGACYNDARVDVAALAR
ncbi:MAG TPA: molybdopterin-dependent oxidoreductase [Methylomirabilota bacterium]|nr:molybdopterin-dependent oxidoreductase [Methylomirabilota bacterium]